MVGLIGTRASHSISNNAYGASNKVAAYTARVGRTTIGGQSMSMPVLAPQVPKLALYRHSRIYRY